MAHVGFETADAGAWYSGRTWVHRGNVIRHNTFRDIAQHEVMNQDEVTVGVYCDDQLSDTLIWNNSFTAVQMGVQLGGGRNHTVVGNTFTGCGVAVEMDARGLSQPGQQSLCRPGGTFQQVWCNASLSPSLPLPRRARVCACMCLACARTLPPTYLPTSAQKCRNRQVLVPAVFAFALDYISRSTDSSE